MRNTAQTHWLYPQEQYCKWKPADPKMAQEVTDSCAEAQKEFGFMQLEKTPPQHNYFLQKKNRLRKRQANV